jgi:hypothetical protein
MARTAGTFTPVAGEEGWWEVCLGGGTWAVEAETGICTCPDYEYRHAGTPGELCRHGEALAAYLDHEKECPVCSGRGAIQLRGHYVDDHGPIPCAACGGSGLKPAADG